MNTTDDQFWSANYAKQRDYTQLKTADLLDIIQLTGATPGAHLDIGCGTGNLTRDLYHLGYQSTGIDFSEAAIALARQANIYTSKSLQYIHGDFMSLPFDETFSLISCKLVYAFMPDKPAFLKKVHSLLATNGSFVLITPVYEQGADVTPISVECSEVRSALQTTFSYVIEKDLDWAVCFICKQ